MNTLKKWTEIKECRLVRRKYHQMKMRASAVTGNKPKRWAKVLKFRERSCRVRITALEAKVVDQDCKQETHTWKQLTHYLSRRNSLFITHSRNNKLLLRSGKIYFKTVLSRLGL